MPRRCWLFAALFLTAAITNSPKARAQSIPGSYRLEKNPQPEGGTNLFLLPDSTYVIVYFGGARVGRWSVRRDTLLYLTPTDVPEHPFQLFGRRHSELKSRARIFFTGEFGSAMFVGAGKTIGGEPVVRRVFSVDANCISFPNVDTLAAVPDSLFFAHREDGAADEDRGALYTFANPARYNDFVAVRIGEKDGNALLRGDAPFAAVRPGGLYLYGARFLAARGELPESEEDRAFFAELVSMDPAPDSVLYNPAYNGADGAGEQSINPAEYTPVPERDAWVLKKEYELNEDYSGEGAFHDMRLLYLFRAVAPMAVRSARFKVEERPVFSFSCE